MVHDAKRIKIIDAVNPTNLSDAALDAVVGGRMKLPGPAPSGTPYGGAGGQPIDIQWAQHPNYLGPF
jgi:hypothetical protein